MQTQMKLQLKMIISRLFAFDQRLIDFLFEPEALPPKLRDRSENILNDSWELEAEEQILVRAALDIWNGRGNVFLWEILNKIESDSFYEVLFAMADHHELIHIPDEPLDSKECEL